MKRGVLRNGVSRARGKKASRTARFSTGKERKNIASSVSDRRDQPSSSPSTWSFLLFMKIALTLLSHAVYIAVQSARGNRPKERRTGRGGEKPALSLVRAHIGEALSRSVTCTENPTPRGGVVAAMHY